MQRVKGIGRWVLVCVAALAACAPGSMAQPWPEREPGETTARRVYEWTSEAGLRFAWCLPNTYEEGMPHDLVLILPPTQADYQWGFEHHRGGTWRKDEIVVSMNAPRGGAMGRVFKQDDEDARAVAEFIEELRRRFTVDRVVVYGHADGGAFGVYVASAHPEAVQGVVAASSGTWPVNMSEALQRVPIVFLHGTLDPIRPYALSAKARQSFERNGHPMVRTRRLAGWDHAPAAAAASECVEWCLGMTTQDPHEAAERAGALMQDKPASASGWSSPPPGGLAADVARRFESDASAEVLDAVRAHAGRHLGVLRERTGGSLELEPGGTPWLGYLHAVREDYRGVEGVERFLEEIGYGALEPEHDVLADQLLRVWYGSAGRPATGFAAAVNMLPGCYLYDGLPMEMLRIVPESMSVRRAAGDTDEELESRFAVFEAWSLGLSMGLVEYVGTWQSIVNPGGVGELPGSPIPAP